MKTLLIFALIMSAYLISVNSFCLNNCHDGRVDIDYDPSPSKACYCDHYCQQNNDCCSDFCDLCPAQVDLAYSWCNPIIQVPINNICQASSRAVPNSWCQTYCIFGADGFCTSVMPHMSSVCECHNFDRTDITTVCKSQSISVPDSWCATYCHITQNASGQKVCNVDAHMSSICACALI